MNLDTFLPLKETDNRIYARVASQISLTVRGENIYRELQRRTLRWCFDPKRNVRDIPDKAWEGESFEIDAEHSEQVEAVKLIKPKYWALRLRERLKDPSRTWTTEVGLVERTDTEAIIGCRVICSQRGMGQSIPRSIPSFVRGIAFTQEAFLDGRQLSAAPWLVHTEAQVEELVAFLENPYRSQPVVVFSLLEGSTNPGEAIIPVKDFVRRTVGGVHTVVITSDATFQLTDRLGREFSVYRQAVRTYNSGFDSNLSLPNEHPMATAERICAWNDTEPDTFLDFLVQQTLRPNRRRFILEQEQPPFLQVKRIAAEQARQEASDAGYDYPELLRLADEETKASKQEARDAFELACDAEAEKNEAVAELLQFKARYSALQERLNALVTRDPSVVEIQKIPDKLSEIEEWVNLNLSGHVEMHQRALRAVRDSQFEDVEFVYKALLLLRDNYVPMKRIGGAEYKKAFEQRLSELGLENTACFSQRNAAKKFGDEYFVQYQGKRRELDMHLKGRSNRDERLGFRLYYFWDAESAQVIVGYLPGHLKNDVT